MSKENPSNKELSDMIHNYGAKNEEDLKEFLFDDWDKMFCPHCNKNYSLTDAVWIDDEPYHRACL